MGLGDCPRKGVPSLNGPFGMEWVGYDGGVGSQTATFFICIFLETNKNEEKGGKLCVWSLVIILFLVWGRGGDSTWEGGWKGARAKEAAGEGQGRHGEGRRRWVRVHGGGTKIGGRKRRGLVVAIRHTLGADMRQHDKRGFTDAWGVVPARAGETPYWSENIIK